jgi:hypothetical protein
MGGMIAEVFDEFRFSRHPKSCGNLNSLTLDPNEFFHRIL